ncbi:hypothetical protein KM043_014683 [Ampulex compressa]|nr:hypothetical protein KM043_014683 [Ampulex compressa]
MLTPLNPAISPAIQGAYLKHGGDPAEAPLSQLIPRRISLSPRRRADVHEGPAASRVPFGLDLSLPGPGAPSTIGAGLGGMTNLVSNPLYISARAHPCFWITVRR